MITIRDVALKAGVAISTVSRVLSGGSSSEKARERVLQAIKELGYRPNQMARGLVRRESRTIGFVMSDLGNPFFPALARGVEGKARSLGYAVLLANTDENEHLEEAAIQTLLQKRVDGLIVTIAGKGSAILLSLIEDGFPLVVMDRRLHPLQVNTVAIDNGMGAKRAVEHLLSLGHRRIAYIGGVPGEFTDTERLNGYLAALRAANIPMDEALIRHGHFQFEGGYNSMGELLRLRPTAVFAANDIMALGACKAVREAGLNVPGDLSIIGFDDIPAAGITFPALTTVRQPAYDLGGKAAELLIQVRLGQSPMDTQEILFQPELVERDSVAPINQEDA